MNAVAATSTVPPLRVLHVNSLLRGGGTDDQCVKLAFGLFRLGQRILIAAPEGREFSRIIHNLGVPFHPTPPEGPMKLRFILTAAQLVRRERIQIIHGHHGRDLWPTVLAARLSGARPKVVLTRHLAKSPSSWASRRFLLGQCDALVAVSQFVARVLSEGVYEPQSPEPERRRRLPLRGDYSKIQVIHGGIDTDRFRPFDDGGQRAAWGLVPEHFAFGVVGGYDLPRGKGQREFLLAVARVHQRIPRARFLIVGRGNLKEALEGDIQRLGLREKAWLTPYCNDMPAAMNALDCLVHPQVGTEAFPGVVLEAFACGKPVVASRLDGIPEAFATGNVGRLVEPESISELAQALEEQARQPAMDQAQRTKLHEKISSGFSLAVMARKTLALYRRLSQVDGCEPAIASQTSGT
ncbi:MAG TPA: glycosyltransferase family 4 protein [Candidatus Acidoferrum sp.]|jgi:glycosyltransferase involved in cell wall biosynthesis|nr:glycosyltransferase family 4 protein [Candidatus Acidoferrum sp.]